MVIKACLVCKYHKIRDEEDQRSYCRKEYCWSEFSDCMTIKALEYFLREQNVSFIVSDTQDNQSLRCSTKSF
jgi:hypothetical protein